MVRHKERLEAVEVRGDRQAHEQVAAIGFAHVVCRHRGRQRPNSPTEIRSIPSPAVEDVANQRVVKLARVLFVDSVSPAMLVKDHFRADQLLFVEVVTKTRRSLVCIGRVTDFGGLIGRVPRPLRQLMVLFEYVERSQQCDCATQCVSRAVSTRKSSGDLNTSFREHVPRLDSRSHD